MMETLFLVNAAVALSTGGGDLWKMVKDMGPVVQAVMALLVVMSVVSWGIIIMKYRTMKRAQKESKNFQEIFWASQDVQQIFKKSRKLKEGFLPEVFRQGVMELNRLRQSVGSREARVAPEFMGCLSRTLVMSTNSEVMRLSRAVSFLATTGNSAPFIGLFGTVVGILTSFHSIGQKGSANLAVVAPGIAEALLATAMGLLAAIPAVVAYNYFVSLVREAEADMTNFQNDFLNLVERDILAKAARSKESPGPVEAVSEG